MTAIFTLPRQQPVAGDVVLSGGQYALRAYPAAKLEFYQANTLTPVDVFSNAARSTAHPWPVVADSSGKFPVIYLPAGVTLDAILKTSAGVTVDTYEDIPGDDVSTSSATGSIGREMPVGAIVYHSLPEVPAGWLRIKRDPQALLKSAYPELNLKYSALGYPYGSTSTTFNIPGGAGLFARIWDDTSTYDPEPSARLDHAAASSTVGNIIGSRQASQNNTHTHGVGTYVVEPDGSHNHFVLANQNVSNGSQPTDAQYVADRNTNVSGIEWNYQAAGTATAPTIGLSSEAADHDHTLTGASGTSGGSESRPANVAFPFIIFVSPQSAAINHSSIGLPYKFNAGTTDADPGSGFISLNDSVLSGATEVYISKNDAFNSNVGPLWGEINNITGSRRAIVTIYGVSALSNSVTAIVTGDLTDNSTYWTAPISVRSDNGAFTASDYLSVQFALSGPSATEGEIASYTVSELAAITSGPNLAIASDGRKNGEGVGLGTGVLAFRVGSSWFACDTGATVAA